MNRLVQTISHSIEIVSFNKFIKTLDAKYVDSDFQNIVLFSNSHENIYVVDQADTEQVQNIQVQYAEVYLNTVLSFKDNIFCQFKPKLVPKKPLLELVEELAIFYTEQFGHDIPNLVKLDKRTWLFASPRDFQIFLYENKKALVCLHPHRTVVLKVHKFTPEDIVNKFKQIRK